VTTRRKSGKVKRIRNNPDVEIRPCNRMGRLRDGAPVLTARAEILEDSQTAARLAAVFSKKYGLKSRLGMWMERRGRNPVQRVVLRLTA
jgi:PPOX class probable F420-dependent enzyme